MSAHIHIPSPGEDKWRYDEFKGSFCSSGLWPLRGCQVTVHGHAHNGYTIWPQWIRRTERLRERGGYIEEVGEEGIGDKLDQNALFNCLKIYKDKLRIGK